MRSLAFFAHFSISRIDASIVLVASPFQSLVTAALNSGELVKVVKNASNHVFFGVMGCDN
jgi:hypothetical protein